MIMENSKFGARRDQCVRAALQMFRHSEWVFVFASLRIPTKDQGTTLSVISNIAGVIFGIWIERQTDDRLTSKPAPRLTRAVHRSGVRLI